MPIDSTNILISLNIILLIIFTILIFQSHIKAYFSNPVHHAEKPVST